MITATAFAQPPDLYRMYSSESPPGVIGKRQLKHGRVPIGRTQPIRATAPAGTIIAAANSGSFHGEYFAPAEFGLQVGEIYRFKLTDIPQLDGVSLYPSVEIIGHLNPPEGKAREFPVPIVFTYEDLRIAAQGGLVTRVVYVEDADLAIPGVFEKDEQPYFEVARGEDPLHAAEVLGRPVAIVRIGSKTPDSNIPSYAFTFGSPTIEEYSESRRPLASISRSQKSNVRRVSHTTDTGPKPVNLAPIHRVRNEHAQPVQSERQGVKTKKSRVPLPVPFAPASRQLLERSR